MHASQTRLSIRVGAGGTDTYGTIANSSAFTEIEHIQEWLMDPVACPTEWPTLLRIRAENPNFGNNVPAAAA